MEMALPLLVRHSLFHSAVMVAPSKALEAVVGEGGHGW